LNTLSLCLCTEGSLLVLLLRLSLLASFYTGPVNGADNHTHQLGNFRVNDSGPIQLSSDKTVSLSGILDLGTNGKEAWNDVNATVDISKGRSISIELEDEDTERHFMGQHIYGIVERLLI